MLVLLWANHILSILAPFRSTQKLTLESLDRVKRGMNRNKYDQFFRYPIFKVFKNACLSSTSISIDTVTVYEIIYVQRREQN